MGVVQPLVLTADTTVDPADHVLQEGALSDIPIGRLESGEVRELETPLCFVACGRFHVQVEAWAISSPMSHAKVGSATLKAIVREEDP
jgi:trafficking protein particle complex subunit 9